MKKLKKLGRLKLMPEQMLSQNELVNFRGGSGTQDCILTTTYDDGNTYTFYGSGFSGGSAGSSEANDTCVDLIINSSNITGCSYDCEYDGWGN